MAASEVGRGWTWRKCPRGITATSKTRTASFFSHSRGCAQSTADLAPSLDVRKQKLLETPSSSRQTRTSSFSRRWNTRLRKRTLILCERVLSLKEQTRESHR